MLASLPEYFTSNWHDMEKMFRVEYSSVASLCSVKGIS
jgi:hypothetical protein